jgi:hypothetical protein
MYYFLFIHIGHYNAMQFQSGHCYNSLLLSSFFHKIRDSENTSTCTVNCNNRDEEVLLVLRNQSVHEL